MIPISNAAAASAASEPRVAWVDYAKGICIILVVMMHTTLTYGADVHREGWMHQFVLFAQPFRMPDFFLISGLFLSRSIHAPLREYLDRKVLHFAYFYLLWLAIQLAITERETLIGQPFEFAATYARALIEPVNTLWFVHMLAVFYFVTRLVRAIPAPIMFALAAALHVAYVGHIVHTGSYVINEFSNRYVFFFAGYAAAPWVFNFSRRVAQAPRWTLLLLVLWATVNGVLAAAGAHFVPGISLVMGFAGASAIVAIGTLLAQHGWARPLRYVGINSIVVYLTFFFPRGVLSRLAERTIPDWDVSLVALFITAVAVVTPLIFHAMIRDTRLNFLYVRPRALRLIPARAEPSREKRAAGPGESPAWAPGTRSTTA